MSTNYYYRPNPAGKLAVLQDLHIGKSAGGWLFNFQAYKSLGQPARESSVDVGDNLKVRIQLPAVPALELTSANQWLSLMVADGGRILDEYDQELTLNEFQIILEDLNPKTAKAPNGQPLRCPFEAARMSHYPPAPGQAWKDEDGYAFTLANFS